MFNDDRKTAEKNSTQLACKYSEYALGVVNKITISMTSLPGIVPKLLQEELTLTQESLKGASESCNKILSYIRQRTYERSDVKLPGKQSMYNSLIDQYNTCIASIGAIIDGPLEVPHAVNVLAVNLQQAEKMMQALLLQRNNLGMAGDLAHYSLAALMASSAFIINVLGCVVSVLVAALECIILIKNILQDSMANKRNIINIPYHILHPEDPEGEWQNDIDKQPKIHAFEKAHAQLQRIRANLAQAMTPMDYVVASLANHPPRGVRY